MKKQPENDRTVIELEVNRVAGALKMLKEGAIKHRAAITAESAAKITNYLRILVNNLGEDLERLARTNVPPPGEFSLDADIPTPTPPIPSKPVYRGPELEGRPVGQKPGAVKADSNDISFIDDKES